MSASAFPADKGDIEQFVNSLFCYADPETYISLRAFEQSRPGTPPILIEAVQIKSGTIEIVARAARASIRAANNDPPGVFAPPVATFSGPHKAADADVANGLTISVELDAGDPTEARRRLEHLLGPVTIAMHSGSEWLDPETGECHPKSHFHWRLSEPTRSPEDYALLKRARWAAAALVGGDMTAVPPCHPLRWAGSWNRKGTPRLAKIYAGNQASEVHLADALEKLEEAVEAAGLKADKTPHNAGKDPQARIEQVRAALARIPNTACKDWHEWNRMGMTVWRATGGSTDGLMAWSDWCAKDGGTDEGCPERWAAISASPPSRLGFGTLVYLARLHSATEHEPVALGIDDVPFAPLDESLFSEAIRGPDKPDKPDKNILPFVRFIEAEANLDAADFVQGLLVEGALSIVYGQSNAGKTFWVTDLAFHVASGRPWNGREVTQGGVIYLALEGSYGIMNRIAAFRQENGLDEADLPFVVVPIGLDLLDSNAHTDAVIATTKHISGLFDIKVLLIVVDTVARAIAGGNENSSEDMGAFVRNLDAIKQETGAHVMGIHHSGKDEAKGARGWSGLRGAIDTEVEVKAEGDTKTAEVLKQRDMPKGGVFGFKLKQVILGKNRRDDDVTSCIVEHETGDIKQKTNYSKSLSGNTKRAFDVLVNLIAQSGSPDKTDKTGMSGLNSVPEKWWRDRFYQDAMPGEAQETKQKAFKRASTELINNKHTGMMNGRVWIVNKHNYPHDRNEPGQTG